MEDAQLKVDLDEGGGLGAVLTTSVEWMVPTPVGQVGLELQVLNVPGCPSTQELVSTWTVHLQAYLGTVLERGVTNTRMLARALLELLAQEALGQAALEGDGTAANLLVWPAALILRPAGQDVLQVRVRATLTVQAPDQDPGPPA